MTEFNAQDLKESCHILFADVLKHEAIAQKLGYSNDEDIIVIWHRTKGFLLSTTRELAEIRKQNLKAYTISLEVLLKLYPGQFCSRDVITTWLHSPLLDEAFSIHPEMNWTEPDGIDSHGYPSVVLALGMI